MTVPRRTLVERIHSTLSLYVFGVLLCVVFGSTLERRSPLECSQGDITTEAKHSFKVSVGVYVWAGAYVRVHYSHHECPCHLLCSLPCPPWHNILLVELAAALLAAMRSPTHTVIAALGCASHGCSLLLFAPVSGFQDCELRCAVPSALRANTHTLCLFVCVYVLTYQSCM